MKRAGLILVLAICVVFAAFPAARLAGLVAIGRSPDCPLRQAVQSSSHMKALEAAHNRIVRDSVLAEQDDRGFDLWNTPKGRFWMPRGSRFVLQFNLAEQELRIYGEGEHFIHSGDVVLDCGANVGVFTKTALDSGASKIVAIEPAPENLECLRRNFAAQIAAGRVVVVPKGVWDHEDVLALRVDPKNSAADSFVLHPDGAQDTIQVPLTTVDALVKELGLARVDFIKMDIEGSEPQALQGSLETVKRFKPRIAVSAYHVEDHPRRVPSILLGARSDYRMECGPCELHRGEWKIRPDVLRFY